MHGESAVSPSEVVHGRHGPAHETVSFPSPGEYMRVFGVAVVVTLMGPADVGMYAVTLMGFQILRGTQNHVPTFTTILSAGGAVFASNMFTNRDTRFLACSAIRGDTESAIQ